jgi:hypothetical protein
MSTSSRLTSLSICNLITANLLLNYERPFKFIKILRIAIDDLDINQIELSRLSHVFPHLFGFQIGSILHTQLKCLIDEKLAEIMPTGLHITFSVEDLRKIQVEKNAIDDETSVEYKHESEQKPIQDALTHDATSWLKNNTLFGIEPNVGCWNAFYYTDKSESMTGKDHLILWL